MNRLTRGHQRDIVLYIRKALANADQRCPNAAAVGLLRRHLKPVLCAQARRKLRFAAIHADELQRWIIGPALRVVSVDGELGNLHDVFVRRIRYRRLQAECLDGDQGYSDGNCSDEKAVCPLIGQKRICLNPIL
ncbi:unnamed protein product [Linum trigynum]|uniref:Uncharacterized protein n=1 Tax=Linum trigynum TaxID=586398 RepID=A0AAV2C8I6_9ROSI